MDGAEVLRQELERRNLSIRGFARLLAGKDASQQAVEKERRMLYRVLAGGRLEAGNAQRVAAALDADPAVFQVSQPEPTDLSVRRRLRELEEWRDGFVAERDDATRMMTETLDALRMDQGDLGRREAQQRRAIAALRKRVEALESALGGSEGGRAKEGR